MCETCDRKTDTVSTDDVDDGSSADDGDSNVFDPTDIDGGGVTPKPKKRTSSTMPRYSELIQAAKRQRFGEFFD